MEIVAGLLLLAALAAFAAGLVIFGIIAIKAQLLVWGKTVGTDGFINRMAHRWHAHTVRSKAWLAEWERAQADKAKAQQRTKPGRSTNSAPLQDLTDENAERTRQWISANRDRIRADYIKTVPSPVANPPEPREMKVRDAPEQSWRAVELRAAQRQIAAQQAEIAGLKAQLAGAMEQPRRKVKKPQPRVAYDPGRPRQSKGKKIDFTYVDSNGEVTEREVHNWDISGGLLKGFCLLRYETRTFRLDRVIEWGEWN